MCAAGAVRHVNQDRFFSFQAEGEYNLKFFYRAPDILVGVQLVAGGAIHMVSTEEGERLVQAIWDAAQPNFTGIKQRWMDRAEETCRTLKLSNQHRDEVFRDAEAGAAEQARCYTEDLKRIMAGWRDAIGEPDPDLALSVYKASQERAK